MAAAIDLDALAGDVAGLVRHQVDHQIGHFFGLGVAAIGNGGRALLAQLMEYATQAEFVHAHVWRPGDLLMWDNRSTMHRAMPFDETKYVRELRRTTVAEDVPVRVAA